MVVVIVVVALVYHNIRLVLYCHVFYIDSYLFHFIFYYSALSILSRAVVTEAISRGINKYGEESPDWRRELFNTFPRDGRDETRRDETRRDKTWDHSGTSAASRLKAEFPFIDAGRGSVPPVAHHHLRRGASAT